MWWIGRILSNKTPYHKQWQNSVLKLSKLFGIISTVAFLLAVVSVVLPFGSAMAGLRISNVRTSSGSQSTIPSSLNVTNKGLLAIDGVYVRALVLAPSGIQLSSVTAGPVDLPPGSTIPVAIALVNGTAISGLVPSSFGNYTSVMLEATAGANFGGIIPVSVVADFNITSQSSADSTG
jgi:hypothetical protein